MKPLVLVACLAAAACGGGRDEPVRQHPFLHAEPVTIESVFGQQSPVITAATRGGAPPAAEPAPAPRVLAPATSEDPLLTVEDEQGRRPGAFQLQAVRGKGFPELQVLVHARRLGDTAAPAPVRPWCRTAERCEYRLARTYVVSLSKSSALQLVPRGEGLALVARALTVPASDATEVRLTSDEHVLGRASVVLLPGER